MPKYDYKCKHCKHEFEYEKKMIDPNPVCPKCGLEVRRLIKNTVPVYYHGQGFASTDDGLKRDKNGRIVEAMPDTPI